MARSGGSLGAPAQPESCEGPCDAGTPTLSQARDRCSVDGAAGGNLCRAGNSATSQEPTDDGHPNDASVAPTAAAVCSDKDMALA